MTTRAGASALNASILNMRRSSVYTNKVTCDPWWYRLAYIFWWHQKICSCRIFSWNHKDSPAYAGSRSESTAFTSKGQLAAQKTNRRYHNTQTKVGRAKTSVKLPKGKQTQLRTQLREHTHCLNLHGKTTTKGGYKLQITHRCNSGTNIGRGSEYTGFTNI